MHACILHGEVAHSTAPAVFTYERRSVSEPYCCTRPCMGEVNNMNIDLLAPQQSHSAFVQIKTAYRQRAKELHPDLNPGANAADHARFADVTEAYQVPPCTPQ